MLERPLILHLSADYPDPIRERTTPAVERLIDGLTGCDHVVVSLKRQNDPRRVYLEDCGLVRGRRLFAYGYFAPPLGVGQAWFMAGVARRVGGLLAREGLRPHLVHAHRLTFEGLSGWWLAEALGTPVFFSVRGEVERKVLRWKPTYRPLLRRMLAGAARVYLVSGWFREELQRLQAVPAERLRLLPNIVGNTRADITPVPPRAAIATVLHLAFWRRKGLDRLLAGFKAAAERLPGIELHVIGGGEPRHLREVEGLVGASGLGERVRLLGPLANAEVMARLPGYLALALPARNETFGMVYTEALFAGIPILYGRESGIDGYLDGLDVGVAASPGDTREIAAGLVRLVEENARFRRAIAAAGPELHRRFDPHRVHAGYEADVRAVLAGEEPR